MTQTDPTKAFFDFWATQGEALAKAQAQTTKAFADGLQAMSSGALLKRDDSASDVAAGAAEMGLASKSFADLWSAATALSGTLVKQLPAATKGDTTAETTLVKMLDPSSWMGGKGEMDDVLGRMAEGPRFADLWEIERLYARVVSAWIALRRCGLEHHAVVLEAWIGAGQRFSEQLARRTAEEVQSQDSKAALALWTETANKELLENQRSAPFLRTQSAMIRATTDLRLAQQALIEHFGKQYGFPTRTELDDVHHSVTELRRELRALQRKKRASPPEASSTRLSPEPTDGHAS